MAEISNTNIDANYSTNMKVAKPKISAYEAPPELPKHHLFSDKDANQKIQKINTDIYEGAAKEKANHEFSFSKFFKIFGGITLTALVIACIRKLRGGK